MDSLNYKIDFAMILRVKNANPNGDPLNGNRPRTDYGGLGEMTDVCLKRKIRDRLVERFLRLENAEKKGQDVFVQSDDRKADDAKSLKDRAEKTLGNKLGGDETASLACQSWIDVRTFGQLFAYASGKKGKKKSTESGEESGPDTGVSIGIRGPVSIQSAFSVEPVSITSTQITKSVSGEGDGSKRSSDTMGMKHRVDQAIYVTYGSMNPQLAERTGFSDDDSELIKSILPKLFENDASSARPEGSMEVLKVFWWKHSSKAGQYSSAKVHSSLKVNSDGTAKLENLEGLVPVEIDGF
jgi:CRISPR-associated protein Csd2